tara:strand:- start:272 stop:1828 length:1557 start_codon:yes stop_codon:yes gene_type:complete
MKIKNIVIVGGGTAGWATAHHFINNTSPDTKITVVAAKEIPIIGVGESTTGRFNDLIRNSKLSLGDENEFLKETESTFKIGIKHTDWHTVGKSFYSPLGDNYYNHLTYPSKNYDMYRVWHIAKGKEYIGTFQARLMAEDKLHFLDGQNVYTELAKKFDGHPIAYHLDTYKVGQYLKRKAINCKSKLKYIDGKVEGFAQDKNGFVKHIILKGNKKVKGDLFVDCTGFARVLIDKIEKNKWVSYQNNLLVDSALNFNYEREEDEPIRNYTHAWAQKHGWCWEIPTQTRMGCGYVFSSEHTDFNKAYDEISKVMKKQGKKVNVQREIKFKAGRYEKFWIKNVLSTGLSSAFIEPLEATSIHATIMQVTHFLEHYFKKNMPFEANILQDQYNSEMTQMWDNIRDFIVYHYISPRKDTKFWIESSKEERRSTRLKQLMNMWKYRMPREVDYVNDVGNNFYHMGNTLWYQIAMGMKLIDPKLAQQELDDYNLTKSCDKFYDEATKALNDLLPKMPKTNNYYESL